MALELPYGIKITNPKANIDEYYGPYNSLQSAYEGVPTPVREIGKTVGIKDPSTGHITEYWWQEGIENSNLVKKEQTELNLENGTGTHAVQQIGSNATGNNSFAEGDHTTASGESSHSEGRETIAASQSQHVFGEFNMEDNYLTTPNWVGGTSYDKGDRVLINDIVYVCIVANSDTAWQSGKWKNYGHRGTYVEIVGNGTANNTRSNVRTLDWEGNEVLSGSLSIDPGPYLHTVLKKDEITTYTINAIKIVSNEYEHDFTIQADRLYVTGDIIASGDIYANTDVRLATEGYVDDYVTNLEERITNVEGYVDDRIANLEENLADVATSGSYIDLTDTPTKTSDFENDGSSGNSRYVEEDELATVATSGEYTDLEGIPSLADVATTGDYDDLENTPTKLSDFINDGNGDSPSNPFVTESDIEEIQEVMSPLASTQNKLISQSEAQDLVNTLSLSPIMADSTGQKSFDFESQMYSTLVQGSTNLEAGPWYKNEGNGFQPCNSTTGVYVSLNDSAVIINDESLFFYFMHGYRYQRVKVGVQGVYGKIKTPYGEEVNLNYTDGTTLSGKFANIPCIYFYDDHNLFGHTGRVIYVCQASNLVSKTNAAEEYLVAAGETINDIAVGTDPDNTSDLVYPTTKYVCTQAQTASTDPVWAYRVIISESSNLADVAFTGNYTDLQNKPLNSISITYTPGGQGGEPEYNTTTITLDGTVHNIQVPTVVRTVNPSNKNAVASSAVAVALASKLDSSTFQEFQQDVILAGGKIEDPQGELITHIGIHSTVNVYVNKITSGSTAYKIVHGAGISDTYFVVYDVTSYQGRSIYFSQSAATRLRMCQTNAVSASDFKDLIDAQTDILNSNHDVITYNNCLWVYDNETPTTLSNMEIPIQSGATTLIIYVGNAEASTEMSTTGLKNAFLDDIISFSDPDPDEAVKATNAVQSGVLYTKFSQIAAALAGMPTKTSDLINDGEGGSPLDPYVTSSDLEASQSDLNYIMGN